MLLLEEYFKWHLEAFASELFIYTYIYIYNVYICLDRYSCQWVELIHVIVLMHYV